MSGGRMKKERIQNVLLFILVFLAVLSCIMKIPLSDLDELWNYSFARNMAGGMVPYRDFSMLQMPLLPMLCGAILKVTVDQLIVMRVLAGVLCASIFYIAYKILNKLEARKEIAVTITLLFVYLFWKNLRIDYNFASLLVTLILILYELKHPVIEWIHPTQNESTTPMDKIHRCNIVAGVLAGLTFALKQTSGFCIVAACIGYPLLLVRNKDEFKKYLRIAIFRFLGASIPAGIILIYLVCTHAVGDFISYTIQGASGFSNYVAYKVLLKKNAVGILSILVPVIIVVETIRIILLGKENKVLHILAYGMAMMIIVFPISDTVHFLVGSFIIVLLMAFEISCVIEKMVKKEKIKVAIFTLVAVVLILKMGYDSFGQWKEYIATPKAENTQFSKLEHYRYIPISVSLEKQIQTVDEYIMNSKEEVKMLDASAVACMIPINQYHKNYDMLLKGNLGKDGEHRVLQEITNATNTRYIIINRKYKQNWQTPMEIINYVRNHKQKINEVTIFDVYE